MALPAAPMLVEDEVKQLVGDMMTFNAEVQRRAINSYFHPDAEFQHLIVNVKGRERIYRLFRFYTLLADSRPEFINVVVSPNAAFVYLKQHVRPRIRFVKEPGAEDDDGVQPTLVVLRFADFMVEGIPRKLVTKHIDHFSFYGQAWTMRYPDRRALTHLMEQLFRPLAGTALSFAGLAVETSAAALDLSWLQKFSETFAAALRAEMLAADGYEHEGETWDPLVALPRAILSVAQTYVARITGWSRQEKNEPTAD